MLVGIVIIAIVGVVFLMGEDAALEDLGINGEEQITIDFNCGEEFDYEGYSYKTVEIVGECWFAEDLRYDNGCMENEWGYSNVDSCREQSEEYDGLLYQWSAVMDGSDEEGAQGICPAGWHIPTQDDWETLTSYLDANYDGRIGGDAIKDPDVEGWCSDESVCGEIEFLSLPAGNSSRGDEPINIGTEVRYWSSTVGENDRVFSVWVRDFVLTSAYHGKTTGHPARCIQN